MWSLQKTSPHASHFRGRKSVRRVKKKTFSWSRASGCKSTHRRLQKFKSKSFYLVTSTVTSTESITTNIRTKEESVRHFPSFYPQHSTHTSHKYPDSTLDTETLPMHQSGLRNWSTKPKLRPRGVLFFRKHPLTRQENKPLGLSCYSFPQLT